MNYMDLNIPEALENLKKSLILNAAVAFVAAVAAKIIQSKQTQITIDGNIPAELVALGKPDSPNFVYVSSKKAKANLFPAILSAAAAYGVHKLKKMYEENNNIVV
jgi:hypothetical protein